MHVAYAYREVELIRAVGGTVKWHIRVSAALLPRSSQCYDLILQFAPVPPTSLPLGTGPECYRGGIRCMEAAYT